MGCSYRIWGTGPLHGWVMSVILGLAKYLWDARPSPSWPNLPTGTRGATFHSAKTHWGRTLRPESSFSHSSFILFSVHKRWAPPEADRMWIEWEQGKGRSTTVPPAFFFPQGIQLGDEQVQTQTSGLAFRDAWGCFEGGWLTLLPQGPGQSHPSWAYSPPRPALPSASMAKVPNSSNLAIRPAPSFSIVTVTPHFPFSWPREQTQVYNLGRPIYGHRGFQTEAVRYHLSKSPSRFRILLKLPSFLQQAFLISSCV